MLPRLDLSRSTLALPALTVLVGSVAALLGTLVTRVLMARALPPAALGLVVLGIAVVSPLGGLASLGLASCAAERIGRRRTSGQVDEALSSGRTAVALAAAVGTLGTVALVAVATFAASRLHPGLAAVLVVLSPVVFGLGVGTATLGVARGWGDSLGRAVLRDGGGSALRAGAVALVAWLGGGTVTMAAAFAAGSLVAELAFVAYSARSGWFRKVGRHPWDRALLSDVRPFAALEAVGQFAQWMDVALLGLVAEPEVVGYYGVARGLGRAAQMIQGSVAYPFLPQAAGRSEGPELYRLYRRARLVAFTLLWPILVALVMVPDAAVTVLFGAGYLPAAPALRLLGVALVVDWLFSFKEQVLIARGEAVLASRAALLATGLAGAVLLVVAPRLGAVGGALGVVVLSLIRGGLAAILLARRWGSVLLRLDASLPAAVLLLLLGSATLWPPLDGIARVVGAVALAACGSLVIAVVLWRDRLPRRTVQNSSAV